MFGGLIAILIALGFYKSAESKHLPGFQWAFAGVVAFYLPNFIWSLTIAKPMMNQLHAQNATGMASFLGFSSVIIGALVAGLVYMLVLRRASTQNPSY